MQGNPIHQICLGASSFGFVFNEARDMNLLGQEAILDGGKQNGGFGLWCR